MLAPRLLYRGVSGGYSGPASRSGVPLEHPPYQQLPAWLQGESKDTPCPAMYSELPAHSFQASSPRHQEKNDIVESRRRRDTDWTDRWKLRTIAKSWKPEVEAGSWKL